MAVTLGSTGITFPDATTQTTAAGASPVTLVQSINFSGQTTFSLALDFTTYPGGYQLVFNNAFNSGSGSAPTIEYSANSGSSWSFFSSGNTVLNTSGTSWSNNINYSGYWAYPLQSYGAYGTGISCTMQIAAKNNSSNTSAIIATYYGTGMSPAPAPYIGGSWYYTYGAQAFTNVRFGWTGGTWASGSVRILGYK